MTTGGTPGLPTSHGTAHPTGSGTDHSTVLYTGEPILGTMEAGTRHGITTRGTSDTHGHGVTVDGTIRGTGILGTIADGMVAGTADGTIHGITEDGGMVLTITTTDSSPKAAA